MAVKDLIQKLQEQKTETITVRIPTSDLGRVDDLAASLGVTRQRLLVEVIKDGITDALRLFDESRGGLDGKEPEDSSGLPRYFILNTNKANDKQTHDYMLTSGIAAAYCDPWKEKIEKLRKGDVVFLYESGTGIVATGIATGKVEKVEYEGKPENSYQQKLERFRRVKPLNAREIKKQFSVNLVFLQTLFKISADLGTKIHDSLEKL